MKPEAQRIAIAKACGWEESAIDSKTCYNPHGAHCYWSDVPDYLNDLSAMHEAEEAAIKLSNAGGLPFSVLGYHDRLIARHGTVGAILSSATERAEQFLKTLGKWEDA